MFIFSSDGKLSSTPWYGQIGKFNSMFKSRTGKEVRSTSSRLSVWYIVVNILIQVGVFVNSVPARVRMTVCDSGNLNFQNSSAGSDNQLSHEDLQELNLKPGENKARWSKLTLSKKARKIICSFNLIFTAQISTNWPSEMYNAGMLSHLKCQWSYFTVADMSVLSWRSSSTSPFSSTTPPTSWSSVMLTAQSLKVT